MRKKPSLILPFALFVLIAVTALTGCSDKSGGSNAPSNSPSQTQSATIGEGGTVFPFEVKDDSGKVTGWNVHTDETTVGAALLEAGLVKGDVSDYGLMVTEVNGITADYNIDKSYWAFYVDGDYATAGVGATAIEQGKKYSFVYTKE